MFLVVCCNGRQEWKVTDMDWNLKKNEKSWLLRVSMLHHPNHRKKKKQQQQTNKKTKQKWLVLPGEICFLSSSQLYRSILCVDKGTK